MNREGGGEDGGLQWQLLLKVPEECPSGCLWRRRGLDIEMGEAVGRGGGNFNDDNTLKRADKCPECPMQFPS